MSEQTPLVGVLFGSTNDLPKFAAGEALLKELGIGYEVHTYSAHRTPKRVAKYCTEAAARGMQVLIAGAGLSAALPGVVAAHSLLPVIGLPLSAGPLNGLDALYAVVQMPPGVPVGSVGIDNARNAVLLAARIIALNNAEVKSKLQDFIKAFDDL
jgi:phosphoribosylaminoimidazole carboxylase PurE protein